MTGSGTCTIEIYVYQLDDQTYGAGLIEAVCKRRGRIVERWPVNDQNQINFTKKHGSAFTGVKMRVKTLAEKAEFYLDNPVPEYDEEHEALLIELCELPFRKRFRAGFRVIFGQFQE